MLDVIIWTDPQNVQKCSIEGFENVKTKVDGIKKSINVCAQFPTFFSHFFGLFFFLWNYFILINFLRLNKFDGFMSTHAYCIKAIVTK